jgi:G3E family GTPase
MPPQNSVPVTIITGFLGSGKTTLLNRLLKRPSLADTAVIVNEFGAVGIDHHLIEQAVENAVLMKNGCICCSVRGDIADTLELLWEQRARGVIPFFSRIAIETTGLADPGPVAHTLVEDKAGYECHLDGIVTTVDALHGVLQLGRQEEARNQVALADRILLTKSDLASPEQVGAVERRIRELNSAAPIHRTIDGDIDPDEIFGLGPGPGVADARIASWLAAGSFHDGHGHEAHDHFHHDHAIGSVVLRRTEPIAADSLRLWLDSLLSIRGADVLRLKGLVRLAGETRPLVLQGVHHVLHKPIFLASWPSEAGSEVRERTELVLITRGLSPSGIEESFAAALGQYPP